MTQIIQTGVLIGGASDGVTLKLKHIDMPELIRDRPRPLSTKPERSGTSPTRQRPAYDLYRLSNVRCYNDGVEFLFYHHDSLTPAEAFAMLFKHYGEKAK